MAGIQNHMGRVDLTTFLEGTWVTSYSAFIHDLPSDVSDNAPPQLGGFQFIPGRDFGLEGMAPVGGYPESWKQTNGFFVSAVLLVLKFGPASVGNNLGNPLTGDVIGHIQINRSGKPSASTLTGTYGLHKTAYNVVEGAIDVVTTQGGIKLMLRWFGTSERELEFMIDKSMSGGRANISRGTLKYVEYDLPPPAPAFG